MALPAGVSCRARQEAARRAAEEKAAREAEERAARARLAEAQAEAARRLQAEAARREEERRALSLKQFVDVPHRWAGWAAGDVRTALLVGAEVRKGSPPEAIVHPGHFFGCAVDGGRGRLSCLNAQEWNVCDDG